jgi:pimeloyl-ACP methyl ester carboxylesterase
MLGVFSKKGMPGMHIVAALFIAFVAGAATTAPAQAATPIREASFVKIGGIEQWITIDGGDRDNPVVLFLHGGPSDAESPYARAMYAGWDKDFTLVQWDQRGAGRTYGKTGPAILSTMTIERMVQDGIEVSEFLIRHLHKKKVIIVGGSWGSILGVYLAHDRPDLFYAYVGQAQLVSWWGNVSASYRRVLELARAAKDQPAIDALTTLGPPPWKALRQWPVFRKQEQAYQKKIALPAPDYAIDPAYASAREQALWHEADDKGFMHFWGLDFAGPLTKVDLPKLGSDFSIPVYIVQGSEDLTALPELAKAYFDGLRAPRKQFHLVPGAGHEPDAAVLALTRKLLLEQVRPMAQER